MKRIILCCMVIVSGKIFGQEMINPLAAPDSPAASILGMQPGTVLKPKSFRALEAALFSNFSNENVEAANPDNFGLEFMPYWAKDHGLSIEEYLYPMNAFTQIARNSPVSLASTQNFLLQDETLTKAIFLGYRTSIFFGNKEDSKVIKKQIELLVTNQQIGAKVLNDLVSLNPTTHTTKDDYLKDIKSGLTTRIHAILKTKTKKEAIEITDRIMAAADDIPFDANDIDSFFISFGGLVEKKVSVGYDELGLGYEKFKEYILARQGLSVDLASAIFLSFPDNNFNFSEVPRYSVWLTPSYSFSKKLAFLKINACIRYERYYK